jgi:hypothetical protein
MIQVICASCGADNDAGRKFCLECGTPLAAACPACGSPNPPAARFCGECGIDEVEGWATAHVAEEPSLASSLSGIQSARALQHGDLATASSRSLEGGRLDPYNAVSFFSEATLFALLAGDRGLAEQSLQALRTTGSHAAVAGLVARVGEAGIAALDGRVDAARAGLLAAYASLRDLGAARKQAITGLAMAMLLGTADARVRAAISDSRQLFERMGAGLWLGLLDDAEAGQAAAPAARPAAPRPGVLPDAPVPADQA